MVSLSVTRQDGRSTLYGRIYDVVRRVPKGRVATYGQVALLAGHPGHARLVGYALHSLPQGSRVPWHRVINAKGGISLRTGVGWGDVQRTLLESEGVIFDDRGRVSLSSFRWRPRAARPPGPSGGRARRP